MKEVKLINGGGSQNKGYMLMSNHCEELADDVLWQLPALFTWENSLNCMVMTHAFFMYII